jgi:hypothetical protein
MKLTTHPQFGAAATVGILTGLTLGLSSTIITSSLGMQDLASPRKRYINDSFSDDEDHDDEEETPSSSPNEKEWQWLEPSPSRRRPLGGLLSQTILEEDDDSDQR